MNSNEKANQLFESGKAALKAGETEQALKMFSMSLSYSNRPAIYLFKAQAEQSRNQLEKALREVGLGLTSCERDSALYAAFINMKQQLEAELDRRSKIKKDRLDVLRGLWDDAWHSIPDNHFAKQYELPSLRMHLTPTNNAPTLASRFGGTPLVPSDFQWPTSKLGKRLNFICQLNLMELDKFESISQTMPKQGSLAFFLDINSIERNYVLEDNDLWKVCRFPQVTKLTPCENPETSPLRPSSIIWQHENSYAYPAWEFNLNPPDDVDEDGDFLFERYAPPPYHRLLGHPHFVQGNFLWQCQLISDLEEQKRSYTDSFAWRLLLQLDSDESVNMNWGDQGCLYFAIKNSDLENADFSKIRLEMQTT